MQENLFDEDAAAEKPQTDTRKLVAIWVDAVRETSGLGPPKATIGRMAAQVKALLETHPPEMIEKTLLIAADEGRAPAAIPDLMLRVQTQGTQARVREWVKENGWPTGTRFKRGEAGGVYIRDPLGYDRAPYAVPWSSPTREELRNALDELGESG